MADEDEILPGGGEDELEYEPVEDVSVYPDLNDNFSAPQISGDGVIATCPEGIVPTLVRYTTMGLAGARALGVHVVEYGQKQRDTDELLVINQDDFPRTKEGYLQQADCVIGVETVQHRKERYDAYSQAAQRQKEMVLGEQPLTTDAPDADKLAQMLQGLSGDKRAALITALSKNL